jgi:hypothetical protein
MIAAGYQGPKVTALRHRLRSHATGRRRGDQFRMYDADRFVLPTFSSTEIADVAAGRPSLDALVR